MTEDVFLVGATGVGKSDMAFQIARQTGAAILALDAMQVYRGADIGTSKPGGGERKEVPHGGIDLVEFGASFDVAQYLRHAGEFLREQQAAGRRTLIVGGTGLYFRALTRGLCEAPQGSETLRAELALLSVEQLGARLMRVDPGIVMRLDLANPRRLARAIQVMETTGRSLYDWQLETPAPLMTNYRAWWVQREPDELEARLKRRTDAMLGAGWAEEVRDLIERHGAEKVQAFPGIGYRNIVELLAGRVSETTVRREILVSTRQYARRQLTWFAREPNLQPAMLTRDLPWPKALLALL